ncbi:hypothetical protein N9L92_00430 [Saprospiraceae bacterium]|nr:hypothetical protein [Saprospiraceae bacterium]
MTSVVKKIGKESRSPKTTLSGAMIVFGRDYTKIPSMDYGFERIMKTSDVIDESSKGAMIEALRSIALALDSMSVIRTRKKVRIRKKLFRSVMRRSKVVSPKLDKFNLQMDWIAISDDLKKAADNYYNSTEEE